MRTFWSSDLVLRHFCFAVQCHRDAEHRWAAQVYHFQELSRTSIRDPILERDGRYIQLKQDLKEEVKKLSPAQSHGFCFKTCLFLRKFGLWICLDKGVVVKHKRLKETLGNFKDQWSFATGWWQQWCLVVAWAFERRRCGGTWRNLESSDESDRLIYGLT
jgi:hypothetical protein